MVYRFTIFVLASILFYACSADINKNVVAEYGNDGYITLDEFEKAYAKSIGDTTAAAEATLEDYKSFLDLFINFKMKLRDAEVRGLPQDEDILREYKTYKKNVGKSFIIEKEVNVPGKKELYEKRKDEIRVSHIMITTDTTGSKEGAKQRAEELLGRIKNGENFEDIARRFSQDHYSSLKRGDIYYIRFGQIVPEFDYAVYNCEVGEVYPEVVKTSYGYHIIKVTERIPARHSIRASHILIKTTNENNETDTVSAKKQIEEIYAKLKNGENFEKLAKQYSDDKANSEKGGDLGFFGRRRMVPEFDEVAFKTKVGEFSEPVETRFGYHIIKVNEEKPYPSFEEQSEFINKTFKERLYEYKYGQLIDSLRKEYNFTLNEDAVKFVIGDNDSVRFDENYWNSEMSKNAKDTALFSIGNKSYYLDDIVTTVVAEDSEYKYKNGVIIERSLNRVIKEFSDDLLIAEKVKLLEKNSTAFVELMDEYRNGIYIFKLQEDEVWNKIELDSAKLYEHWEKNKEKYTWNNRVNFSEIFVRTDSLINAFYDKIEAGESFDSIATKHTLRSGYRKTAGKYATMDADKNELTKKAYELENPGDVSKPFKFSTGYSIVKLNEKFPARMKTFEEATPEVTSEVQELESQRLEQEYIERLIQKYKPTIKYDELSKAFKGEEK